MYLSQTKIRVHYGLTDQMGVVYHSHYQLPDGFGSSYFIELKVPKK